MLNRFCGSLRSRLARVFRWRRSLLAALVVLGLLHKFLFLSHGNEKTYDSHAPWSERFEQSVAEHHRRCELFRSGRPWLLRVLDWLSGANAYDSNSQLFSAWNEQFALATGASENHFEILCNFLHSVERFHPNGMRKKNNQMANIMKYRSYFRSSEIYVAWYFFFFLLPHLSLSLSVGRDRKFQGQCLILMDYIY